jgi:hypothetical protein
LTNRVLIVSPHFPPINAPDHQRIRMSLPYLAEFGWQPTILMIKPEYVEGRVDSTLLLTVPETTRVIRTKALSVKYTRRLGMGSLGVRALPFLREAGNKVLRNKGSDLIYFSTTMFPVMALGPYWRGRWQVPYVLDFQDPWLSNYYDSNHTPVPPGGRLKYGLSKYLARRLEPRAMRRVSHVVSVSPAYPRVLLARYPWLDEEQFSVLPFCAAEKDFESVAEFGVSQGIFNPNDGKRHWVYVGRGGGDMANALRVLFLAIRQKRELEPERFRSLMLHFIGTDYAPDGRAVKTVEPIAHECGIGDLVEEQTSRVPYLEALKILTDSHAILLFGSDDSGYTASKLYPCILSRKPILGVFHEQSTVVDILRRCNAGRAVTFASDSTPVDVSGAAAHQLDWLLSLQKDYEPETNWEEFQPYTAREMTRRQCEIFDHCMERRSKNVSRP